MSGDNIKIHFKGKGFWNCGFGLRESEQGSMVSSCKCNIKLRVLYKNKISAVAQWLWLFKNVSSTRREQSKVVQCTSVLYETEPLYYISALSEFSLYAHVNFCS